MSKKVFTPLDIPGSYRRSPKGGLSLTGFTLIEMVAVIVLMGTAIPPLFTLWADIAWRSSRAEAIDDSTFYAQELMEEIKSKAYDENGASPWSPNLGPNAESYPNYDDVDDFNGYSDTPASGYTRAAMVDYIMLSGTSWGSCGAVANCNGTNCSTQCTACCYKRITVTVSRGGLASNISMNTIVSSH